MKPQKILLTLTLVAFILTLVGCGSQTYIDVSKKKNIAVVSFCLNRTIGGQSMDAGLLQDKETYDAPYQKTIDMMYDAFEKEMSTTFLNASFMSKDDIIGNEFYQSVTTYEKKVILGADASIDAGYFKGAGLNYAGFYDKAQLAELATNLGSDLLVSIMHTIDYAKPQGASVNGISIGKGGVNIGGTGGGFVKLTTSYTIFDPETQHIASLNIFNTGEKKVRLFQNEIDAKKLPEPAIDAQRLNIADLTRRLQTHRDSVVAQQSVAANE